MELTVETNCQLKCEHGETVSHNIDGSQICYPGSYVEISQVLYDADDPERNALPLDAPLRMLEQGEATIVHITIRT